MSYKYSSGPSVTGDLKAQDDTQRDTVIDFGEDQIEFQTSGSTRARIHNQGMDLTGSLHITSSTQNELIRLAKTDPDTREIVFEMNGADRFDVGLNSFENLLIQSHNTTDDIYFRLNGHNALYLQGYPKQIRVWDSYSSTYDTVINSKMSVNGPLSTLHTNEVALDYGYGEIVTFGTGSGLTKGKTYYLSGSTWAQTNATDDTKGADTMVGIALGSSISDGMLVDGYYHFSASTGFLQGVIVYFDTTNGGLTQTAPTGPGNIARAAGYCTSDAQIIRFKPSSTWIES